jgi:CheY-like chemotaxis protein
MASILIIDDNDEVRRFLRAVLEQRGYTVIEAAQGNDALQQLHHAPVDLVLTDIYMPDCDGLEVIMKLRREFPAIKIVAISGGAGDRNLLMAARQLGAKEVLAKPIDIDALLKSIASALNGEVDSTSSSMAS